MILDLWGLSIKKPFSNVIVPINQNCQTKNQGIYDVVVEEGWSSELYDTVVFFEVTKGRFLSWGKGSKTFSNRGLLSRQFRIVVWYHIITRRMIYIQNWRTWRSHWCFLYGTKSPARICGNLRDVVVGGLFFATTTTRPTSRDSALTLHLDPATSQTKKDPGAWILFYFLVGELLVLGYRLDKFMSPFYMWSNLSLSVRVASQTGGTSRNDSCKFCTYDIKVGSVMYVW